MDYLTMGDAEGVSTLYAHEAEFLSPRMVYVKGKENIATAFEFLFAREATRMILTTYYLTELGPYRFLEGNYTLKGTDGQTRDTGKYTILWMQEDGHWRIYRSVFYSDFPLYTIYPDAITVSLY